MDSAKEHILEARLLGFVKTKETALLDASSLSTLDSAPVTQQRPCCSRVTSGGSAWTSVGSSLGLAGFSERGSNMEVIACHSVPIISSFQGLLGNPGGMDATDIRQMFGVLRIGLF